MNAIVWPEQYAPGTTDNYVSNETIVAGLNATDVWPFINNTSAWLTYYSNASDIRFHDNTGPELSKGARFRSLSRELSHLLSSFSGFRHLIAA